MIDLHTHTLFSDGALLPSELVFRAKVKGYDTIAITDHGDFSNIDFVIPRIIKVSRILAKEYKLRVIPGVELTYVPPALMKQAVRAARKLGAKLVVIHGETVAETVPKGTNRAGILSGADIIAHPGLITEEDVRLAKSKNLCLEITTRRGHNKTNPLVAGLCKKIKTKMVLNTDSHMPEDLMDAGKIKKVLKMSGLDAADLALMQRNSYDLVKRIGALNARSL
jgi:putative hydrolase